MKDVLHGRVSELVAVVVIIFVASIFRYIGLDIAPPGMTGDEAMNGMNISELLKGTHPRGALPIFFFDNVPKEPLFIYLQTISVMMFGKSVFALRFVSASLGLLTLCATFALTRKLFGKRVALITLGLIAFSFWHVFASRVGLRSISLPFFIAMTFFFLWRGYEKSLIETTGSNKGTLWNWLAAGVFAGLGFYTYPASRFVPLVILSFIGYLSIRHLIIGRGGPPGKKMNGYLAAIGISGWAYLTIGALIVSTPLLVHWTTTPSDFTARSDSVLMFNPVTGQGSLSQLVPNLINGLGMFSFTGEPASRWGMADRPIFDPASSVFFYVGIILVALRLADPRRAFILIWLVIMVLPDILTRDSPQFCRAVGILPVVFMFPALAMDAALKKFETVNASTGEALLQRKKGLFLALIPVGWIIAFGGFTIKDYFYGWNTLEVARQNFSGDLFSMARFINVEDDITSAYVAGTSPQDWDRANLDFLVQPPKKARSYDARESLVFPADYTAGKVPLLLGFSRPPRVISDRFLPESARILSGKYFDGGQSFDAYDIRRAPRLANEFDAAPLAVFGGLVELRGYEVPLKVDGPGKTRILLKWKILARAPRDDYSFFVHLIDSRGNTVAQRDGNGYAPADWEAGEEFLTWYDLDMPAFEDAQILKVDVGMYSWRDHKETRVLDSSGKDVGNSVQIADVKAKGSKVASSEMVLNPVEVNFEGKVTLSGYLWFSPNGNTGDRKTNPDQRWALSLRWKALQELSTDYTVFVHLLDEKGNVVAQQDSQPRNGSYPTSKWDREEIVNDVVMFEGGSRRIVRAAIGLYEPTGKRLFVVDAAGNISGDSVMLEAR